jgi:hypothetical protein
MSYPLWRQTILEPEILLGDEGIQMQIAVFAGTSCHLEDLRLDGIRAHSRPPPLIWSSRAYPDPIMTTHFRLIRCSTFRRSTRSLGFKSGSSIIPAIPP